MHLLTDINTYTHTHTRSVRQVQSYLHNEAGQVSKGTALCAGVKWGLHIWQRNRSVNPVASLTLVYTLAQISKQNGDQRGQWSSCTATWMLSCYPPPLLPLFHWCLLLQSDAHVGYREAHLSNAWLQNALSSLSLSALIGLYLFARLSWGNVVRELDKLWFVFTCWRHYFVWYTMPYVYVIEKSL